MADGDTPSSDYPTRAAAWAEGLLAKLAGRAAAGPEAPPAAPADLVARFGLDDQDGRVLAFVCGVGRSLAAWRLVHELSARRELTVAVIHAALGDAALAELAARKPLRLRSLVEVSGLPGGHPEPEATVELSPGMSMRLAGGAPVLGALGSLVSVVRAQQKPTLHESITIAVREHIIGTEPTWVSMTGARPEDAAGLADALSFRGQRPVVLVDGRAVGALPHEAAWRLLAAVRRECDLDDAPLVIDSAAAVRTVLRAVAAPALPGPLPKTIVLVNLEANAVRPPEGFTAHTVSFVFITAPPAPTADADEIDPIEAARRQAGIDAADALGKPRPSQVDIPRAAAEPPPATTIVAAPPPTPPRPGPPEPPAPAAVAAPAPTPAPRPEPPPPPTADQPLNPARAAALARAAAAAGASLPTRGPTPAPTPAPAPAPAPAPTPTPAPVRAAPPAPTPAPVRAAAPAPTPVPAKVPFPFPARPPVPGAAPAPPAAAPAPSGAAPSPLPAAAPAPDAAPAATASPAETPAAASPDAPAPDATASAPAGDDASAAVAPAEAPPPDPAESLPYLPAPSGGPINEIIAVLYRAPNPLQRAELLAEISMVPKDVNVVKALRAFINATHPKVRAAAEAGLEKIFGANRTKPLAIPPPVQPPRTED